MGFVDESGRANFIPIRIDEQGGIIRVFAHQTWVYLEKIGDCPRLPRVG